MDWTPTAAMLRKAAVRQREQARAGREYGTILKTQAHGRPSHLGEHLRVASAKVLRAAEDHEEAAQALTRAADAMD